MTNKEKLEKIAKEGCMCWLDCKDCPIEFLCCSVFKRSKLLATLELQRLECPFERGEMIEVYNDNGALKKNRIFVGYIKGTKYPYICVLDGEEEKFKRGEDFYTQYWEHARKIQPVKEVSMKDIANALNVDVKDLRIKDYEK